MRSDVARDFGWQAQFADSIRRIVGPFLLVPAPMDVDMTQATDFLMFKAGGLSLAARIRGTDRSGRRYADLYPNDITIRSRRDNGTRTEWAKIIEDGFADWMFYGHATGVGTRLYPFFLIDLAVLREMYAADGTKILTSQDKANGDGTYFHVIRPGSLARSYNRPDLIITWEHSLRTENQLEIFDEVR